MLLIDTDGHVEEASVEAGVAGHVDDLGAFVHALTATIGHYRGEGHCAAMQR